MSILQRLDNVDESQPDDIAQLLFAQALNVSIGIHPDGNCLAQVLPALTPGNHSRLFGPADDLLYASPDYPGPSGQRLTRASRAGDWPPAPPGMMRLSQAEIDRIEFCRLEKLRRYRVAYLRRGPPRNRWLRQGLLDDSGG